MKDTLQPLMSSVRQDWCTPPDLYSRLYNEFKFTLDPCSSHENHLCEKYYTVETNGLEQDWSDETCYINPPYSDSKAWIKKAHDEWLEHNVTSVMLIPSRTDTVSWFNYVSKAAQIRFIKGRLKFSGHRNSAPFPSAIVVFSNIIYPEQVIFVDYKTKV